MITDFLWKFICKMDMHNMQIRLKKCNFGASNLDAFEYERGTCYD